MTAECPQTKPQQGVKPSTGRIGYDEQKRWSSRKPKPKPYVTPLIQHGRRLHNKRLPKAAQTVRYTAKIPDGKRNNEPLGASGEHPKRSPHLRNGQLATAREANNLNAHRREQSRAMALHGWQTQQSSDSHTPMDQHCAVPELPLLQCDRDSQWHPGTVPCSSGHRVIGHRSSVIGQGRLHVDSPYDVLSKTTPSKESKRRRQAAKILLAHTNRIPVLKQAIAALPSLAIEISAACGALVSALDQPGVDQRHDYI